MSRRQCFVLHVGNVKVEVVMKHDFHFSRPSANEISLLMSIAHDLLDEVDLGPGCEFDSNENLPTPHESPPD
jgi:hypothetical protein